MVVENEATTLVIRIEVVVGVGVVVVVVVGVGVVVEIVVEAGVVVGVGVGVGVVVGVGVGGAPMTAWTDHVVRWKDCTACPLHTQRDQICLARGQVPCDVLFIGEAPGASEDAIGQPFVGPAGQLLDQIIARALSTTVRYALTNLVCCYPREAKGRGDNEPETSEIDACVPRLAEFIALAAPRVVVFVGGLAGDHGPKSTGGIMYAGGSVGDHPTLRKWVDITHPAAILRMPLVQRQMAAQKCIVQIRSAVEGL